MNTRWRRGHPEGGYCQPQRRRFCHPDPDSGRDQDLVSQRVRPTNRPGSLRNRDQGRPGPRQTMKPDYLKISNFFALCRRNLPFSVLGSACSGHRPRYLGGACALRYSSSTTHSPFSPAHRSVHPPSFGGIELLLHHYVLPSRHKMGVVCSSGCVSGCTFSANHRSGNLPGIGAEYYKEARGSGPPWFNEVSLQGVVIPWVLFIPGILLGLPNILRRGQ